MQNFVIEDFLINIDVICLTNLIKFETKKIKLNVIFERIPQKQKCWSCFLKQQIVGKVFVWKP